jgi:hypothetical protein
MKEYKSHQTYTRPISESALNDLAREGWRLIQIVEVYAGIPQRCYWHYLERDREQPLIKSA